MHAPMWTLKHHVLWSCDTKAQDSFFYLSQLSVSKTCSFINSCIHPSPFWAFGKNSQHSPFRCTHTFFLKNLLVFWMVKFWLVHFSKACWILVDQNFYLYHFLFLSISFGQSLQEKIRDSLQIGYSWHPWLHVMENKVCNWKYTRPTFFSVSCKISRSKYDNAR